MKEEWSKARKVSRPVGRIRGIKEKIYKKAKDGESDIHESLGHNSSMLFNIRNHLYTGESQLSSNA